MLLGKKFCCKGNFKIRKINRNCVLDFLLLIVHDLCWEILLRGIAWFMGINFEVDFLFWWGLGPIEVRSFIWNYFWRAELWHIITRHFITGIYMVNDPLSCFDSSIKKSGVFIRLVWTCSQIMFMNQITKNFFEPAQKHWQKIILGKMFMNVF